MGDGGGGKASEPVWLCSCELGGGGGGGNKDVGGRTGAGGDLSKEEVESENSGGGKGTTSADSPFGTSTCPFTGELDKVDNDD